MTTAAQPPKLYNLTADEATEVVNRLKQVFENAEEHPTDDCFVIDNKTMHWVQQTLKNVGAL